MPQICVNVYVRREDIVKRSGLLGVSRVGVWVFFLTGISVSSLSDGIFVLHVPSEDRKQKVWLDPSVGAYLAVLSHNHRSELTSASPLG